MSALRVCVLAVLAVGLASAITSSSACGTAPANSRMYYSNASIACTPAVACQTAYCACIGSTRLGNTTCAAGTTNCTLATQCIGILTTCLNAVASNTACPGLSDLHMALLNAEMTGQWNTSTAYTVCVYRTCNILNATAGSCPVDGRKLCPSPLVFTGTMLFAGNFNGVDLAVARANIERDLIRFFGFDVRVIRVFLRALGGRRQGATSVLVVEFEAAGVNSRNTELASKLNNLRNSGGAALSSFIDQYKAANNGALPIFVGVSAGLGSAAFSGTGIDGGLANGPRIPTNAPTAVPGVTPAPGTPGSTSSTGSSGTTTSGAATQSLIAAVIVAVLGAMMF